MMGLVWSVLGVVSGMLIALQAPLNAGLGRALGLPVVAAAVSFVAGTIALVAVALATSQAQGVTPAWGAPSWLLYIGGGLLGAAYVTSVIVLTPRLGTAATMAFIVTGQLLAGLVLDHFGAFGFAAREISIGRVSGAVLLVAGALLIRIS
jgi:transporter family-2 protein